MAVAIPEPSARTARLTDEDWRGRICQRRPPMAPRLQLREREALVGRRQGDDGRPTQGVVLEPFRHETEPVQPLVLRQLELAAAEQDEVEAVRQSGSVANREGSLGGGSSVPIPTRRARLPSIPNRAWASSSSSGVLKSSCRGR